MVFQSLLIFREVCSGAAAVRAASGMAVVAAAVVLGIMVVPPKSFAAEPAVSAAATSRAKFDPAVVPAGGMAGRHCPRGGVCHHAHCRDGLCVPYCPVRPGQFGYYGTQWRRWPGQGVVPAAAFDAATPALPPKSAVPKADEESPRRPADELPVPEPIGDPQLGDEPKPRGDSQPRGELEPLPGADPNRGADSRSGGGWKRFVVRQPAAQAAWDAPSAGPASRDIEVRLSSAVAGQGADASDRGR